MKIVAAVLAAVALQDRVSPDLLDYQPTGQLKGALELGPGKGFESLLARWAERLKQHHPDLRGGKIEPTTLSTPQVLISGAGRFGLLARRWSDTEIEDFRFHWGYAPLQIQVGCDALSIVVHPENPIRALSLEQLDSIYSSACRRGGKMFRTWGELGLSGDWSQRPINSYATGKDPILRAQFQDLALQGAPLRDGVKELAGVRAVLAAVAEDPCGIGCVRAGALPESARAVSLRPSPAAAGVEPQPESIVALTYPLSWRIYADVRKVPGSPLDAELAEYLRMILSRDGQCVLADEGLVPITGRMARKELLKFTK